MNQHDEDLFVKRSVSSEKKDIGNEKKEHLLKENVPSKANGRISPDAKRIALGASLPAEKVRSSKSDYAVAAEKERRHSFFGIPKAMKRGNVDMVFLIVLLMLLAFGAVMSFSASYAYASTKYGDSYYFLWRQLLYTFVGFVAIVMVTLIPLRYYKVGTYFLFAFAIVLLLLVLVIGSERGGAKRWLEIPGLGSFQPSELAKTALVMMLAMYMSHFGDEVQDKSWKRLCHTV